MVDPAGENWPSFVMVQIHGSRVGNLDWEGPDLTLEVPVSMIGAEYRAVSALTRVASRGHGNLVKFGSTGLFGSVLLDTATGAVVECGRDANHVSLVSSSLPDFIAVVRAVIGLFPFCGSDGDDGDWVAAARSVEGIVRTLDQGSFIRDGFWDTLVNDIEIGDYSTGDVLG